MVEPGATLRVQADLLPGSDGTAPFAIHTFQQITGGLGYLSIPAPVACAPDMTNPIVRLWNPESGSSFPVKDLYHIGASTHPGPGLGGGSGYLVASRLA